MAASIFPSVANGVTFEDVEALPRGEPSLILQYGDDPLQFGELWLCEPSSAAKAPLVILIHGGCWLNEFDLTHLHPLATALAESGFAVWSLEYRRVGDDG